MKFNTSEVAKLLEVPYHKVNYLVRSGIIEPVISGQGIAREFDFFDLVCTKVAIMVRADGFNTDQTKQAMQVLSEHRDEVESGKDCSLEFFRKSQFIWRPGILAYYRKDENGIPVTTAIGSVRNTWYGVSTYANDIRVKILQNIEK